MGHPVYQARIPGFFSYLKFLLRVSLTVVRFRVDLEAYRWV
jgi:hypothetical protein